MSCAALDGILGQKKDVRQKNENVQYGLGLMKCINIGSQVILI